MKKKLATLALLFAVIGSSSASEISSGTYRTVGAECDSVYLPDNSVADKLNAWDTAAGLEVTVDQGRVSFNYKIAYEEQRADASFELGLIVPTYKRVIQDGNLFFNGKRYRWNISSMGQNKIKLHYDSVVVFLSLPSRTDLFCELELVP